MVILWLSHLISPYPISSHLIHFCQRVANCIHWCVRFPRLKRSFTRCTSRVVDFFPGEQGGKMLVELQERGAESWKVNHWWRTKWMVRRTARISRICFVTIDFLYLYVDVSKIAEIGTKMWVLEVPPVNVYPFWGGAIFLSRSHWNQTRSWGSRMPGALGQWR